MVLFSCLMFLYAFLGVKFVKRKQNKNENLNNVFVKRCMLNKIVYLTSVTMIKGRFKLGC